MPEQSFQRVYAAITAFANAEQVDGDGESQLLRWLQSDAAGSIPLALREGAELATLLEGLTVEFADCWRSDAFHEIVEQHEHGLHINLETGDYPELVNAGYPWSDQEQFRLTGMEKIETQLCCTLDEYLVAVAGKSFAEMKYFEFADLTSRRIGVEYDGWYEPDDGMDQKRILLGAVGLIGAIRSLSTAIADRQIPAPLWLSVSEGVSVIGAFTRVA